MQTPSGRGFAARGGRGRGVGRAGGRGGVAAAAPQGARRQPRPGRVAGAALHDRHRALLVALPLALRHHEAVAATKVTAFL